MPASTTTGARRMSGPSIRRANEAAERMRDVDERRRVVALAQRAAVVAVDGMLGEIEEINLAGPHERSDEPIPERVRRLAEQMRRDPPPPVWEAPTPSMLHEALLDWQEHLLRDVRARA